MNRIHYALVCLGLFLPLPASAQPTFDKIVKKASATFEPATAKPGQTVTLKVALELLEGWSTYPTVQTDKAARSQVNKFLFPEPGTVVFVGAVLDPDSPKEKSDPILQIEKMFYYPGGGVWERKAVVSPDAKAGALSSKVKFKVLVCDKDFCLPARTLELEATLKVAGDPVAIDPKYKVEIEKALKK